ncbi:unnamed protein product [Urochloa humidicola]
MDEAIKRLAGIISSWKDICCKGTLLECFRACNQKNFSLSLMMQSHIEEGFLEEADDLFWSVEKNGYPSDSRILNAAIRRLLQKGEGQNHKGLGPTSPKLTRTYPLKLP